MKTLRNIFLCAFLAACTGLAVYCIRLVRSATLAADALPSTVAKEIGATRLAMLAELRSTRVALVGDASADCARAQCSTPPLPLASQVLQLADAQLTQAREMADRRAGDALGKLDGIADKAEAQLAALNATARDLATQADATLVGLGQAEAAASQLLATGTGTVQDVKDSLDDLYPDIKATVESATVAAAGAGRAMDEVAKAAPAIVADGHRVADDVTREADALTKPKTKLQQAEEWVKLVVRCLVGWFGA